ncbi:MAG: alpha-amylase family protein [Cyclobacteriaceae bacterium]|nr:alpha-amylase family protein [Cyclobacteriaceae bacterium]
MPSSSGKWIIYQMMTRLFANTQTANKPHGTLEENGVGKFNDINDKALAGIKALGTTHVWYTGVLEHALLTDYSAYGIPLDDANVVKGRAGSPYAIKDYYDVNPDLAVDVKNRMAEFEQLIARTHAHGLKVIIDFVPNHVARGYRSDAKPENVKDLGEGDDTSVSFKPSNNFYYLPGQSFQPPQEYSPLGNLPHPTKDRQYVEIPAKVTGNDQFTATPGINDWFETVKLNYGVDIRNGRQTYFEPVPNTWEKMRDILVFWAHKKVDGFRCDMAEMVPHEFWGWVIPQVKAVNPEIIFIAEIYNPSQYRNYIDNGRFDYLYDKVQLYDTLRLLVNGQSATQHIAGIQQSLSGINHRMLHFLENHDEQRIASPFFAGDPWKAAPAMVISACVDQAPVMIYFGQEVGEPGAGSEGFSGEDGRTTIFDYWGVPHHQKWMNGGAFDGGQLTDNQKALRQFYGDILTLARDNPAIHSGEYIDITSFNQASGNINHLMHAFVRYFGDERLIIVSSFNAAPLPAKIALPPEVAQKMGLQPGVTYVGRDLLRSGADMGLDEHYSFSLELPSYASFIFKIK